jgi:hypothetical protein
MTISNVTGLTIQYNVQDQSGNFNDGGTINANSYVEFQPRGVAPFTVTWVTPSITLVSVPSPAIVTFWRCGNQSNGGFSQ